MSSERVALGGRQSDAGSYPYAVECSTKVQFCDDDSAIRDILLRILTKSGYLVTMAVDGFDAGIKISEFKPELILMDLIMPGMDGVKACRRIKDNPDTSGIRVLLEKVKDLLSICSDRW